MLLRTERSNFYNTLEVDAPQQKRLRLKSY